eukprot:CAMPEP_0197245240 /NCGR_PEP_ID=MMETSP1429-20130617/10086_1 /TAXON_ID=49237 /ORGANISM="Chaetoceros  sp., Strain UNC1202" /LENGTH=125 /DNA_ID=CAMNT_0042705697 /DNA_START=332 /DNA_END=709 /DNA_ORIENTATION=-
MISHRLLKSSPNALQPQIRKHILRRNPRLLLDAKPLGKTHGAIRALRFPRSPHLALGQRVTICQIPISDVDVVDVDEFVDEDLLDLGLGGETVGAEDHGEGIGAADECSGSSLGSFVAAFLALYL